MEINEAASGDIALKVLDVTCVSCQQLIDRWTQCLEQSEVIPFYYGIHQLDHFSRRVMVVDVSAGLHDRSRWEFIYLGSSLRNGRQGAGTTGAFQQWVRRCGGVGVTDIILEAAQTGVPAAAATRLNVPIVTLGTATILAIPYRLDIVNRPKAVLVAIAAPAFGRGDTGADHHGTTVVCGPWPGGNGAPGVDRSHYEQRSPGRRRE